MHSASLPFPIVADSDGPPVFPITGFLPPGEVQVDDFVHIGDTGYRVTCVVPYDDGTVYIQGVMPLGSLASGVHPPGEELEVTRLVDENLARA